MDLDFYEIYKDLPTTELLKIVHRPDGYQPEAVEAASRHLSQRERTLEDQAAVQAFFEEKDRDARRKTEKIDHLKEQAADLLQPIIQPGPHVAPQKWLNIFLLVLGAQYAWTLINDLIEVYKSIVLAASHLLDMNFLINVVDLIYLPLFFYLLYKRKRWGWILVFAGILVGILGLPMQVYAYSTYLRAMEVMHMGISSIAWFLAETVLKVAFAWFLWRQDVCDLFGVGKPAKMRTLLYTSGISLLVFTVLLILY